MPFVVWLSSTAPGHCRLASTYIENVERLHAGETVPDDFGQPLQYQMSDRFPDDVMLSDNYSIAKQIIVSGKLMAELQAALPNETIQYLPVTLRNHKGRVASSDYFVVHPHRVVDCIDLAKSAPEWNPLDPKKMMGCEALILDAAKIPSEPKLFRLQHWGAVIVVAADLAQLLTKKGFVGLRFLDPDEYSGIG